MPASPKNRLAFLVPFAREAGLGHFYRTLGYYEKIDSSFYLVPPNENPPIAVRSEILSLDLGPEKYFEKLAEIGVRALFMDHYFLDANLLSYASTQKKISTIFFDRDFSNPAFDILLNTNPFANAKRYSFLSPDRKYFLGGSYYLFRREISEKLSVPKIKDRVFLCIGGSDPKEISLRLIPLLDPAFSYDMVIGPGAGRPYFSLVERAAKQSGLDIFCHYHPDHFFSLLAGAERALISASTLAYEASHLNTGFDAIELAANQSELASYLKKEGIRVWREDQIQHIKIAAIPSVPRFFSSSGFGKEAEILVEFLRNIHR